MARRKTGRLAISALPIMPPAIPPIRAYRITPIPPILPPAEFDPKSAFHNTAIAMAINMLIVIPSAPIQIARRGRNSKQASILISLFSIVCACIFVLSFL